MVNYQHQYPVGLWNGCHISVTVN